MYSRKKVIEREKAARQPIFDPLLQVNGGIASGLRDPCPCVVRKMPAAISPDAREHAQVMRTLSRPLACQKFYIVVCDPEAKLLYGKARQLFPLRMGGD